jgi:hypothetical protein
MQREKISLVAHISHGRKVEIGEYKVIQEEEDV